MIPIPHSVKYSKNNSIASIEKLNFIQLIEKKNLTRTKKKKTYPPFEIKVLLPKSQKKKNVNK